MSNDRVIETSEENVFDKYLGRNFDRKKSLRLALHVGMFLLSPLIGMSMLAYFGATVAGAMLFNVSVLGGGFGLYKIESNASNNKSSGTNEATQTINYKDHRAYPVLCAMEDKLRAAFKKAAAPTAPLEEKKNFVAVAREVWTDVKKLYPYFTIAAAREKIMMPDENDYHFVVKTSYSAPGQKNILTLTEAVVEMNKEIEKIKIREDFQKPGSWDL